MRLKKLSLLNFRNYAKRVLEFRGNTALLVGGNGVGKTNILEGCFVLATGMSFRAKRIDEMIMFDRELGRVTGRVFSGSLSDEETLLEIMLTRGELSGRRVAKRKYNVNGVSKRASDFVGRLVVVLFRPEDLRIILGSPQRRRKFFDDVLGKVDRDYRRSLISYENALRRRNRLLDAIRDKGVSRTQLAFWDQLLIKHGQVLSNKREELVEFINDARIEVDSFELTYDRSTVTEKRLSKYSDKEVAAGYTLVGPHKDDFVIKGGISGKDRESRDLSAYGSRGEQRLAILWLKLCELAFVSEKIGERPVLLLDDIFSELDHEHRDVVLELLGKQQTILSTADIHLVESRYKKEMQIVDLG